MTFFKLNSTPQHPKDPQMVEVMATTTAVNGPLLPVGTKNLTIVNWSASIAYVQVGDADISPAGESSWYYVIPSDQGVIMPVGNILSGQVNVALASGSGKVNFAFSS